MSTTPRIKHLRKVSPNNDYLIAEVRIERDYFAVTGDLWEARGRVSGETRAARWPNDPDVCGQLHDEIVSVLPELAPLIALHLSDMDGVPMHALANSWYFYSGAHVEYETRNYGPEYVTRHGTPRERTARILRVAEADLPHDMDKDAFTAYVDSLRPMWAEQARAGLALFRTL